MQTQTILILNAKIGFAIWEDSSINEANDNIEIIFGNIRHLCVWDG